MSIAGLSSTRNAMRLDHYISLANAHDDSGRRWWYESAIGTTPDDYVADLYALREQYQTTTKVEAYHVIQSFAAEEFDPSDLEAGAKVNQLGLELARETFPGHLVKITTQRDGKSGLWHNHLQASNLSSEDAVIEWTEKGLLLREERAAGRAVSSGMKSWHRLVKINDAVIQEHAGYDNAAFVDSRRRTPVRSTASDLARRGEGQYVWRDDLREHLDAARGAATDVPDYIVRLASEGITVTERGAEKNLSYSFVDADGLQRRARSSGRSGLGAAYTRAEIEPQLAANARALAQGPAPAAPAPAAPTAPTEPVPLPGVQPLAEQQAEGDQNFEARLARARERGPRLAAELEGAMASDELTRRTWKRWLSTEVEGLLVDPRVDDMDTLILVAAERGISIRVRPATDEYPIPTVTYAIVDEDGAVRQSEPLASGRRTSYACPGARLPVIDGDGAAYTWDELHDSMAVMAQMRKEDNEHERGRRAAAGTAPARTGGMADAEGSAGAGVTAGATPSTSTSSTPGTSTSPSTRAPSTGTGTSPSTRAPSTGTGTTGSGDSAEPRAHGRARHSARRDDGGPGPGVHAGGQAGEPGAHGRAVRGEDRADAQVETVTAPKGAPLPWEERRELGALVRETARAEREAEREAEQQRRASERAEAASRRDFDAESAAAARSERRASESRAMTIGRLAADSPLAAMAYVLVEMLLAKRAPRDPRTVDERYADWLEARGVTAGPAAAEPQAVPGPQDEPGDATDATDPVAYLKPEAAEFLADMEVWGQPGKTGLDVYRDHAREAYASRPSTQFAMSPKEFHSRSYAEVIRAREQQRRRVLDSTTTSTGADRGGHER